MGCISSGQRVKLESEQATGCTNEGIQESLEQSREDNSTHIHDDLSVAVSQINVTTEIPKRSQPEKGSVGTGDLSIKGARPGHTPVSDKHSIRPSVNAPPYRRSTNKHKVSRVTYIRRSIMAKRRGKKVKDVSKLVKSVNPNHPSDYSWMKEALEFTCEKSPYPATPLFFVFGACPSVFAGMQSIMFAWVESRIEFWWIKPRKDNELELEEATMTCHTQGPNKNDPGRSRHIYQPLADLFNRKERKGLVSFDVELEDGTARAVLHVTRRNSLTVPSRDAIQKLYLYLIWQEEWTTNPFARTKFVKGKMVFRKNTDSIGLFFAREYYMDASKFILSEEETEEFINPFHDGTDEVKDLYETKCV